MNRIEGAEGIVGVAGGAVRADWGGLEVRMAEGSLDRINKMNRIEGAERIVRVAGGGVGAERGRCDRGDGCGRTIEFVRGHRCPFLFSHGRRHGRTWKA